MSMKKVLLFAAVTLSLWGSLGGWPQQTNEPWRRANTGAITSAPSWLPAVRPSLAESLASYTAKNPTSSASGYYQFSTSPGVCP